MLFYVSFMQCMAVEDEANTRASKHMSCIPIKGA